MNITSVKTNYYENKPNWTLGENEPNSNPIYAKQTQSNPILAHRERTQILERSGNPDLSGD